MAHERSGGRVERLIVEAVDAGGPAAKCGLEVGLMLSHIGSGATGNVFSSKRMVEDLVFGDVLRTIKLTPRPLMLYFSGRAEIPKLNGAPQTGSLGSKMLILFRERSFASGQIEKVSTF